MSEDISKKLQAHRAILDQQWECLADFLMALGPTAMELATEVDEASTRKFLKLATTGPKITERGKRLIHYAAAVAFSEGVYRMMEKRESVERT